MPFLGDTTQGAGATNGSDDRAFVTLFTASENGTLTGAAQAYFAASSTAGTSAKVILFSHTAGAPVNLLAVSNAAAIPGGGGLVNFTGLSAVALVSATSYYIGVVYNNFTGNLSTDDSLSGMDSELANGTFSYASPPATWPGADVSYTDIRANVAVEYSTGGAAVFGSITGKYGPGMGLAGSGGLVGFIPSRGIEWERKTRTRKTPIGFANSGTGSNRKWIPWPGRCKRFATLIKRCG